MRPARLLFALACLAAIGTALIWHFDSGADAAAGGVLVGEPAFGAPAETFIGASPAEAEGEVWATEEEVGSLVRYTNAGGWEALPAPVNAAGESPPLTFGPKLGPQIGRTTAAGGVVVLGQEAGGEGGKVLVTRDPGGPLRIATAPAEAVTEGETYLGETPLVAALEAGSSTRALVTHGGGPAPAAVFSLAAGNWTREPICVGFAAGPACEAPPAEFRVIDVEASEGEAWLLGRAAAPGEGIELFHREANGGEGGVAVWRQQQLGPAGSLGARYAAEESAGVRVAARAVGQPLTVTAAGAWVDAALGPAGEHQATIYFDRGQRRSHRLLVRPRSGERPLCPAARGRAWRPGRGGASPGRRRAPPNRSAAASSPGSKKGRW